MTTPEPAAATTEAAPAAVAEGADHGMVRCWCGHQRPADHVVYLGSHPDVAVCLGCAHFLHQRAGQAGPAAPDAGRAGSGRTAGRPGAGDTPPLAPGTGRLPGGRVRDPRGGHVVAVVDDRHHPIPRGGVLAASSPASDGGLRRSRTVNALRETNTAWATCLVDADCRPPDERSGDGRVRAGPREGSSKQAHRRRPLRPHVLDGAADRGARGTRPVEPTGLRRRRPASRRGRAAPPSLRRCGGDPATGSGRTPCRCFHRR